MTPSELRHLPPAIDLSTAARALGLGRTKAYELARTNAFPVKTLRLGKSYRVVTADLLRVLGVEQDGTPVSHHAPTAGEHPSA